jgi:hypothetical protein
MPIEREFKFLMQGITEKELFPYICDRQYTRQIIQQGYLNKKTRLRKIISTHVNGITLDEPVDEYIFTYKKKIKNIKGVLEIENKIEENDFKLGWSECKNTLYKVRYVLKSCNKYKWEIDFFYKNKKPRGKHTPQQYFCLLECEMYGEEPPYNPPVEIKKHIRYYVPEGDKRFVNSRLSNVKYVERLVAEIDNEKS